jgi:outer membrane protein OmpA-like peptidoglycan-associated protein
MTFLHNSDRACYSSSGFAPDSSRDMDIYMIDFCASPGINAITGITRGVSTGTITVTDKETKKDVGTYQVVNGKYLMILPLGKTYSFKFETDTMRSIPVEINVPTQCKLYDIYQEITISKKLDSLTYTNAFFDIAKATVNAGDTSYGAYLQHADRSKLDNMTVATVAMRSKSAPDTLNATVETKTDTIRHTTETTITFNNVLFDFDKSIIKDIYKPDLNKVTGYLVEANKRTKIEVAGHTDSKGTDAYNMALSKRRANVVAVYFVKGGVEKTRIKVMGYGESMPVAPNTNPDGSDNPAGREKNRRTEIIILNTDLGAVIDDYFEGKNVYVLKEINELIDPKPIEGSNAVVMPSKSAQNGTNVKH